MGQPATTTALSEDKNFCKIKALLLLAFSPLNGDIYLRLGENRFVKVFSKGDTFESYDLEKYSINKGVEYLYIVKSDLKDFLVRYNVELFNYLRSTSSLNLEKTRQVTKTSQETIKEAYDRVGFTPEVQALTKTQVEIMIKTVGNSPSLKKLLSKYKFKEDEYIHSHSLLTGYICCSIASRLDWGSRHTFYKLNLAAVMHDIVIKDEKIARCDTVKDAKDYGLSEAEIKEFLYHPIAAAKLVNQCIDVPPGVDEIIMQHHEKVDGSGFPKRMMNQYIAPLSCVFIIGHEMAEEILTKKEDFNSQEFIAKLKQKYTSARMRKVVAAVESSINK